MARQLIGGLEVQDLAAGYWFDLIEGGLDDIAEHRGADDIVPEAAGLDPGQWIADRRSVKYHGIVFGSGVTSAARRASYRARFDALRTRMNPAVLVTLVQHPPNDGLATGQTATLLDVRPLRIVGAVAAGAELREVTLELLCIASPPQWTVA